MRQGRGKLQKGGQLHTAVARETRHAFDAFARMHETWQALPRRLHSDPGLWFRELHLRLVFTSAGVAARARQLLARHDRGARRDGAALTARVPFALACAVLATVGLRFRSFERARRVRR